ncbi:hypothetical protein JW926_06555 [Candidatus Sumerlaeota bacterium]|nr:hypothetical protein [Candidatus Sumerlaeota bacterium]
MSDPYKTGMASSVRFLKKRIVKAGVVVVLKGTIENRGLRLISPQSRCVREKEIFEFMIAEDAGVCPGGTANTVRYLGFAEVVTGGSIRVGDKVLCDDRILGYVAGFDETHMPNHQNIVLMGAENATETEEKMNLESRIEIIQEVT